MHFNFHKIMIGVVVLSIIAAGTAMVFGIMAEVNEPTHGSITNLVYHRPYTTSHPQYMLVPDGDGGMRQQYTHSTTVQHPERFEVVYELYDHEKEKMRRGDCDVPKSMWEDLEVGEDFQNINKRN